MNAEEILYAASDRIEAFGHHKGGALGAGTVATAPACIVGAVTAVSLDVDDKVRRQALATVQAFVGGMGLVDWNDAPERTAEEVIAVLKGSALIEAAKRVDVTVVTPAAVA